MLSLNKYLLAERHIVLALVMCDNRLYSLLLCAAIPVINDNTTSYSEFTANRCSKPRNSNSHKGVRGLQSWYPAHDLFIYLFLLINIDILFINCYPPTIMPSLITKWKKGRPYLYWVRSAWRNGHSRIVEQSYLGPRDRVIEQIRAQFTSSPPPLPTVQTREFGASALFYSLAQELGLIELIDAHVPPAPPRRRTSLSVGHYLVLAALNRLAWPKSKRAFAEWYQDTVLARLVPASRDELSSQRFWDHMNLFEQEHFAPIQRELLRRIQQRFFLGEQCLVYAPPT